MTWRGVAGVLVAVLVLSAFGATGVYAQTAEDMRRSIDAMRKQLDAQQKRLEQLESEQALQQKKTETTVNAAIMRQALESQPPMALLGTAAMPPSAFGLGFFFGFDAQFMGFSGIDFPFAVRNFGDEEQERAIERWETASPDREFSPRFTAGFYLPGGSGVISTNFLWVDADGTGKFADSGRDGNGGVVGLLPPSIVSFNGAAFEAKARTEVEYRQFDIQYQYPIQVTKSLRLTPEVGVRAVWFDNVSKVTYIGCENCNPQETEPYVSVKQKSESRGVGPKLGLGAVWEPLQGLSLGAAASGGFLIGSTDSRYEFCRLSPNAFDAVGCDRAHNSNSDEDMGFPFVGGDFNLTYTFAANSPMKGLSLNAGYRLVSYFDLVTRIRIIGGANTSQNIFERKNLTADSWYFGLNYLF